MTLNNYTQEEYDDLLEVACKYMILGKEVAPTTGTPHLQGYFQFKTNMSPAAVKKLNGRATWLLALGDSQANYKYCSKEGQYIERGERNKSRSEQAQTQKEKWRDVIRSAEAGTAKEEYPSEWVRYHRILNSLFTPRLEPIPVYTGLWCYGPPGTGKSRFARAQYEGAYDKLPNKWWDNYQSESAVLIDDLGMDHVHMGSFLKRYADHYPFRVEFKGGSTMIRPQTIIVTSNYKIEEIWSHDLSMVEALNRRFKKRFFPKPIGSRGTPTTEDAEPPEAEAL